MGGKGEGSGTQKLKQIVLAMLAGNALFFDLPLVVVAVSACFGRARRSHHISSSVGMTMLVLKKGQRAMFRDKLPDTANLALGALVFGQFLGEGAFSTPVALLGVGLWTFLGGCAVIVAGGGES